jgi:hypothetical protein
VSTGLRVEHQILRLLADGPKDRTAMLRALGWSLWNKHRALDGLLQRMRMAGVIEPASRKDGTWQIPAGLEVCVACLGKGVRKAAAE